MVFPLQQWLRERNALLRCTYSVSYVQSYVRLLCTCTVCSVYRVPSVIMCSSTLILPSFAVTAGRFEILYHFSTRLLRDQCQYTRTTRYSTHVHLRKYSVKILYIILRKMLENTRLETVKQKMSERKNNHFHAKTLVRELGDVLWIGGLEMLG